MTVKPGFGGQQMIESELSKVSGIQQWKKHNNPTLLVDVDGGINKNNIKTVKAHKPDIVTVGSGIFKGDCLNNCKNISDELKKPNLSLTSYQIYKYLS